VNETAEFRVEVWPNPAAEYFNLKVESDSDETVNIRIYDITDRLIYSSEAINIETVSFGENFVPGIYIVRVQQGEHFKTVKVAKQ
jgi:hypothetical protein